MDVKNNGTHSFISKGHKGLEIYDTSDRSNMKLLSGLENEAPVRETAIARDGKHVYSPMILMVLLL